MYTLATNKIAKEIWHKRRYQQAEQSQKLGRIKFECSSKFPFRRGHRFTCICNFDKLILVIYTRASSVSSDYGGVHLGSQLLGLDSDTYYALCNTYFFDALWNIVTSSNRVCIIIEASLRILIIVRCIDYRWLIGWSALSSFCRLTIFTQGPRRYKLACQQSLVSKSSPSRRMAPVISVQNRDTANAVLPTDPFLLVGYTRPAAWTFILVFSYQVRMLGDHGKV